MKKRIVATWTVVTTVTLQACTSRAEPVPEIEIVEPSLVPTSLLVERVEALEDTLGFSTAVDLVSHPRGYLVVDGGNDRVVLMDDRLEPRAVFGRSGSGPGELEAPIGGVPTPDGFAVIELSNGRVSFFDAAGEFRRVVSLSGGFGDMAVEPDGSVLVASAPPDAFLVRLREDGSSVRVATRVAEAGSPEGIGRSDKVAVTEDGTVVVLDNVTGELHTFAPDGRQLASARLPRRIVDPVQEASRALRADLAGQGIRVIGDPIAKQMTTQPDGNVLILVSADPVVGILVDPGTLRGRLVEVPSGPGRWDVLHNAVAAVIEGHVITVLHAHGLARFELAAAH